MQGVARIGDGDSDGHRTGNECFPCLWPEINKEEYLFSAEANNKDTLSRFKTNVVIDGHMIPVLIDTGCSTNILTAETFNYLRKQKQYKLSKSKVSLIPYGAQASDTYLHALGTINCLVESNSRYAQDEFFVVNTNATN